MGRSNRFRQTLILIPVGCLDKIGCATVLAAGVAVGAWSFSDHLPDGLRRLSARAAHAVAGGATSVEQRLESHGGTGVIGAAPRTGGAAPAHVPAADAPSVDAGAATEGAPIAPVRIWVPLDSAGALDPAVARLAGRDAPAYVTLTPSAFARLLAPALLPVFRPAPATPRGVGTSSFTPQVALDGHDLLLRTAVDLRAVAGDGALRTVLLAVVHAQDTIEVRGALAVDQPGAARYVIQSVRVRGVSIPSAAIPVVLRVMRQRPASAADTLSNALAIPLPRRIADLRIAQGRAILYRAVQP